MANGGSRIGGFFRGALTGLVVCAIVAVALSLWAPAPERVVPEAGIVVPGGAVLDEAEPAGDAEPEAFAPAPAPPAGEPEAAPDQSAGDGVVLEPDVTVVPAEEPTDATVPAAPAGDEAVAPQPTWEPAPQTAPAGESDEFSAPEGPAGQSPAQ